jgi:hypothetical protein
MFRLLVAIAILAAIAGVFDAGSSDNAAGASDAARAALTAARTLDARSFAMGFVTALVIATLQRISIANLAAVLLERMAGWRRLFKLVALAAGLVGVLMYL